MPAFGSLFSFTLKPPNYLPLSWKTYPSGPVKFWPSSCQFLSSQSPNPEVSDCSQFWEQRASEQRVLLGREPSSPEVMSHSTTVMGFRSYYPEIWHLGLLIILSWRSWRKWPKQEGHSDLLPTPFSPETSHKTLLWEVPSLCIPERYPDKRSIFLFKGKGMPRRIFTNRNCSFPPFTTYLRFLTFHNSPQLFTKSSIKIQLLLSLQVFTSLRSLPCHLKLILNKFVCLSPVNLPLSV